MCMWLIKCLSAADNEGQSVILHISGSKQRLEWGNETGIMRKRTKHQILKQMLSICLFLWSKFIKYLEIEHR